jgi:hypothetical protein
MNESLRSPLRSAAEISHLLRSSRSVAAVDREYIILDFLLF